MINCFITFRKCLRNNSIRTNSASVFTILDIKHTLVRFFGEVPQTIYLPQIYDLNWFKRRQWHSTQYSFLENPMDRGAWGAALHGVAKSQTRLTDFTFTFHFHALEKEMATHSSVLAWRIPGTGEPGGLPSMGSHRVGHD